MISIQIKTLAFVLLFGTYIDILGYAYFLDESCTGADIRPIVEEGLRNAFADAEIAYHELGTRPWTAANKAVFADLGDYTLKDRGQDAPRGMPDPDGDNPNNDLRGNLDKAWDALALVYTHRFQLAKPPAGDLSAHVEIFCNLDRFKSTKKAGFFWDMKAKGYVWVTDKKTDASPDIAMCYNGFWAGGRSSIQGVCLPRGGNTSPRQIQLCPRFLNKLKSAKYRTSRDLKTPLPVRNTQRNPHMDKFFMFDNTLLHELLHCAGAIDNPLEHYGWMDVGSVIRPRAIQNAESVSFLALGIRMISEQGLKPNVDGSVTLL